MADNNTLIEEHQFSFTFKLKSIASASGNFRVANAENDEQTT